MARQEMWDDFDGEVIRKGKKNRNERLRPRGGKFWCDGCDAQLVGAGAKCPNCSHKQLPRRHKR